MTRSATPGVSTWFSELTPVSDDPLHVLNQVLPGDDPIDPAHFDFDSTGGHSQFLTLSFHPTGSPIIALPSWYDKFLSRLLELALPKTVAFDLPVYQHELPSVLSDVNVFGDVWGKTIDLAGNCPLMPAVIPTAEGGIELEWRRRKFHVRVAFGPHHFEYVWIDNLTTDEFVHGPLSECWALTRETLRYMGQPD